MRRGSGAVGCLVVGCERKHACKGYCNLHYQRLLHHGDPLAGGPIRTTDRGEPQQWLLQHVDHHDADDCLTWPYADDGHGYGHLHFDGVMVKAHRTKCELVNGPPPFAHAEAAHGCGMGHKGCVNPHHLRWARPDQNQWDRLDHGTHNRGERCGGHKLVEREVVEIDQRLKLGTESHQTLADEFGVHRCTVTDISKGKSWSWLTGRVFYGNPTDPRPNAANDNSAAEVRMAA